MRCALIPKYSFCNLHRTWLVLLFGMLVPLTVPAQDLVMHRYLSQEPDARFEEILYLAAGVALIQQGLSSIRNADTADFVLLTHYSIQSNNAELNYSLSRTGPTDSVLASMAVTLPIDPALDSAIAEAIWSLFDAAGAGGNPSPDAMIYGLFEEPLALPGPAMGTPAPGSSTGGAQAESPPAVLPPTASLKATQAAPVLDPALTTAPGTVPAHEPEPGTPAPAGRRPDFSTAASMAGLMFVGEAMEYLRYGLGGRLDFGLAWKRPSISFGLDAKASFSRAFNNTGVVGGPFYLGTAGLGFNLGTGTDKAYQLGVEMAGGAAFLVVTGQSDTLAKTVPYLEFGAFMSVPLGKHLAAGGDLRFLAAFDQDLVIMGISPGITIGMEF